MAKFLTSARAVDMLGRQQIAGIPTAVSELFKNAYDAYATLVRADYFPDTRILLIRDNGIGMSSEDFHTRWLTIGTDSKARDSRRELPKRPPGMSVRVQMGEKGIGRLAIASIGPQLLLITTPLARDAREREVLVALVQWSMFEIPGLTLDDVVVPVRTVPVISDVTHSLIDSMIQETVESIDRLGDRVTPIMADLIKKQLSKISIDPQPFLRLHGPNLQDRAGTAFFVTPTREELDAALEVPDGREDVSVSAFQRFLAGFTNTMIPNRPAPELGTRFVLHGGDSTADLIDPVHFWAPEDFDMSDHSIEGEFDELGTFHGQISIYGGQPTQFTEPWVAARGRRARCGPFKMRFGYVQGLASDSRLSAEDWSLMTSKLQRIGGLYVYRDGIRVLPYGNSDNDYLEIERRRTLNVGRYFFSYRRMFGAIELDGERNSGLQEKAGREGFRDNGAYQDFTDILKNFLVQIAANYFTSGDNDSVGAWQTERDRLKRRASVRAKQEKVEQRAREMFAAELEKRISYLETGGLASEIRSQLNSLRSSLANPGVRADHRSVMQLEKQILTRLNRQMESLNFSRPSTLALTADLERELLSFEKLARTGRTQIRAALVTASELLGDAEIGAGALGNLAIDARISRLERAITESEAEIETLAKQALGNINEMSRRLSSEIDLSAGAFAEEIARIRGLVQHEPVDVASEGQLMQVINSALRSETDRIDALIRRVRQFGEGEAAELEQEMTVLQEQVLDLQNQIDENLELMQLGQAVQIVSHEFEASIRSVRGGLQKLSPWARSTPRLAPIVRDLRASFAHLDGYLRLFTPLQRRLYRQSVTITGEEIAEFVSRVFVEKLEKLDIELQVGPVFRTWRVSGYPSTFYPAFVNLVDNAIHWVNEANRVDGFVRLDADSEAMYVRDNGPGVRARDRDAIFERGFSRRRGGRGLGLSLARELLARENWDLTLEATDEGASFKIVPGGTV